MTSPKQREQGQAEKMMASRLHHDLAHSAPRFRSLGEQWGGGAWFSVRRHSRGTGQLGLGVPDQERAQS